MILNREQFPKIIRDGFTDNLLLEHKSNTHLFYARNWDEFDYWYCEIMTEHSFDQYPLDTLLDKDTLDKVRYDDKTFLAISNYLEAFQEVVDHIYDKIVIEHNIPPRKILFISNGNDIYLRVKTVANQLNLDYINVEWDAGWASFLRRNKSNQKKAMLETLDLKKDYTKKFLNLNRRWRPHRCSLIALLSARNLLDKGFVSFAPSDDDQNWDNMFDLILDINKECCEVVRDIEFFKNNKHPLPPLYVDKDNLVEDTVTNIIDNTNHFYENSLFSLVTETNFYRREGFESILTITEKTFKPIISLHPFLLVSIPGSLRALKELGYKTFHPWINETYDLEQDDALRLKKIVDEVERLSNLNDSEVIEFIKNVKSIVMHNYIVITKLPIKTVKKL